MKQTKRRRREEGASSSFRENGAVLEGKSGLTIQWFPGHMAKTRRLITENLSNVDLVLELLDARIPASSKNPEVARLVGTKPTLTLFNKASLADPAVTAAWISAYRGRALAIDCVTGEGLRQIAPAVRRLLAEKLARYEEKGMKGRRLRAMIVGIPNVGKSSLVNRLGGGKKARVEDRPGVTMSKQWVTTSIGIDLLDMPGVLWPKFDDRVTGENLAVTGAIKDTVLDTEELAAVLCLRLMDMARELFAARYKLDDGNGRLSSLSGHELLTEVAQKRGFLLSGGELDTERAANILLDEFRGAKIGRISLETPDRTRKNGPSENGPSENGPSERAKAANESNEQAKLEESNQSSTAEELEQPVPKENLILQTGE